MAEQERPQPRPSAFFVDLAADLRDPEFRIAFVAGQRDLALKSLGRMVERVCSMPDRGGVAAALTAGPGDDLESVLREWLGQVDVPVIRFPASDSLVSRDSLRVLAVSLPSEPAVVIVENLPRYAATDVTIESHLQIEWDHRISRKPVVLVVTGDDTSIQQMLGYDRPLYGRFTLVPVGIPLQYRADLAAAEQWLTQQER